MKSRPISTGQTIIASHHNDRRDDARGGSFLLPHQQLGALALGTTPTNGQVVHVIVNGTTITFTAVTGTPTNPGDVKAPGTAAGFVANLIAGLRRPDLTTSTFIALSGANQILLQYAGWAYPGGTTTIVPFSLNKNVNGNTDILTSFNITTTVTSGTWTAQTMQLYVEDGTYYIGTTRVLFTGGSTPTFTAPSTNPRIDLVTADSSGTLATVTGTESATPSAPSYPANKVVICEVYHIVGETSLHDFEDQQTGQGYVYNDVRNIVQPVYIAVSSQLARGVVTNIQEGTDAGKPGSPSVGDIYIATDTTKVYVCYSAGNWQSVSPVMGNRVELTSGSGAWSVPGGVTKAFATVIGGGGGGGSGGGGNNGGAGGNGGGGGGAGQVLPMYPLDLTGVSTVSYSVGGGGSGGASVAKNSSGNVGTAGTVSTFGGLTATGGTAGTAGAAASQGGSAGGNGGSGSSNGVPLGPSGGTGSPSQPTNGTTGTSGTELGQGGGGGGGGAAGGSTSSSGAGGSGGGGYIAIYY
jgi:hypothetical protein